MKRPPIPVIRILLPSSEEDADHSARFHTSDGRWLWRKLVSCYGAAEIRRAFEFHCPCDEGVLEGKYRAWCLRNNYEPPEDTDNPDERTER